MKNKKILLFLSCLLFITSLNANTSLFYKVHKGSKSLGYYEINYNTTKNNLRTKSYGVANKISFFIDKKINYINDGYKQITFIKNKQINEYDAKTKKSFLSKEIKKKYQRKIKKVKHDDMLLLTKKGKNYIELFNKRKINLLTFEEVLKIAFQDNIKEKNLILFDKSGVMKMIAKIVPTSTGFDIINKSKGTKYIQVIIKNNIPVEVKSYISNWYLSIEGSGKFNINKVKLDDVKDKALSVLKAKFVKSKNINVIDIQNIKVKKKSYILASDIQFNYPSSLKKQDRKRFCIKSYKKLSKKASNIRYNSTNCIVLIKKNISKKDISKPIIDELVNKYPQLKYTKKYKVAKNGEIMYKIIDQVKK